MYPFCVIVDLAAWNFSQILACTCLHACFPSFKILQDMFFMRLSCSDVAILPSMEKILIDLSWKYAKSRHPETLLCMREMTAAYDVPMHQVLLSTVANT